MPISLTAQNVDIVLGDPNPEQLYSILPEVFERLLEPNLDDFTRYTYCKSIHDRLEFRINPGTTASGFDLFADICFNRGLVTTFLQIAKEPRTERWPALAAYFSLQSMWMLMRKGDVEEREKLLKTLLQHDIVDFLLDTTQNSLLAIHRQGAVGILRCLAAECTLGASISPAQASTIVTRMCKFILSGPQFFSDQFGDAALTWQSFLSFGKFGTSREKARKYAPRGYAMAQENAAWTIQGLFLMCPPPNSRFRYEVLKHDPSVIDLLFKIAAMERPPWYADLEAASILCESIVLIFRFPELIIPGADVKVDSNSDVQNEKEEEWDALVNCLKLLTSRPKWVDLVLGVWDHLEAEKPNHLKKMLMEAESKYFALSPYKSETFYSIFEARGSSRICIERLIATLTYATTQNKLSHDDIFSLLRITNAAVRPFKSFNQGGQSETHRYQLLEANFELYRKPLYAVFVDIKVEPPLKVANELYMGPTVHIRLLTLLAENNLLVDPSQLPTSISKQMTLPQLKQICSPNSIQKLLNLSRKRITARREVGHKRFRKDNDLEHACFAYNTAAELAAAIIAFNKATQGLYQQEISGVKREQVLCLGNAAEMALGQEFYDRALCYATAAIQCAESLPTDGSPDSVDVSIRDKNRRRVARAMAGISEE